MSIDRPTDRKGRAKEIEFLGVVLIYTHGPYVDAVADVAVEEEEVFMFFLSLISLPRFVCSCESPKSWNFIPHVNESKRPYTRLKLVELFYRRFSSLSEGSFFLLVSPPR